MFCIKNITRIMVAAIVLATSVLLASCGGEGGSSWDDFEPRAALVEDFAGKAFEFTWQPDGNPIHGELGAMTITFGSFENGEGTFMVQKHMAGSASGTVDFTSPYLTFSVTSKTGDIPLNVGYVVQNKVEADADDGRIRLINEGTDAEVTSDPD